MQAVQFKKKKTTVDTFLATIQAVLIFKII